MFNRHNVRVVRVHGAFFLSAVVINEGIALLFVSVAKRTDINLPALSRFVSHFLSCPHESLFGKLVGMGSFTYDVHLGWE